jgi:hypothetical protein
MTNTPDEIDQDSEPTTKAPDDARPDLPGAGESASEESGSVGGDTGTGDSGSTSQ